MPIVRVNEIGARLPEDWEALETAIWQAYVSREDLPDAGELDLTLVDDATIQELNKTHRQLDKPTDVLSFPMYDDRDDLAADVLAGLPIILGDIMISVPTAERQAQAYGHSSWSTASCTLPAMTICPQKKKAPCAGRKKPSWRTWTCPEIRHRLKRQRYLMKPVCRP